MRIWAAVPSRLVGMEAAGDGTLGRGGMACYLPWHGDSEPLDDTLDGQNPDTLGVTTATARVCMFGRAPLLQHLPGEPSALLRDFRRPYVGDRNGKRRVKRRQLTSALIRRLLSGSFWAKELLKEKSPRCRCVKLHGGETRPTWQRKDSVTVPGLAQPAPSKVVKSESPAYYTVPECFPHTGVIRAARKGRCASTSESGNPRATEIVNVKNWVRPATHLFSQTDDASVRGPRGAGSKPVSVKSTIISERSSDRLYAEGPFPSMPLIDAMEQPSDPLKSWRPKTEHSRSCPNQKVEKGERSSDGGVEAFCEGKGTSDENPSPWCHGKSVQVNADPAQTTVHPWVVLVMKARRFGDMG